MDEINFGRVSLAAAADHLRDYVETGDAVTQILRPMRAATAQAVDRGGMLTTISFTVVRDHDSASEARSFCRSHRRAIMAETATAVDFSLSAGGVSTGRLVDAVVRVTSARAMGVASEVSYQIVGAEDLD